MLAVLQRKLDGTELGAVEVLAVEGSRGKEGASWQAMENAGKRPMFMKDAEKEKQEGIQTRPMAT